MPFDFDAQVTGIGALSDPTRRALYQYVVAQPGPVSRDQAAMGVGVARHIAKFHLDKLLDEGLLAVEFARAPGRRGPGAGRPAKVYSRSSRELAVSVPQRDYPLAGRLLAKAITEAQRDGVPIDSALASVSRATGRAPWRAGSATRRQTPRPRVTSGSRYRRPRRHAVTNLARRAPTSRWSTARSTSSPRSTPTSSVA